MPFPLFLLFLPFPTLPPSHMTRSTQDRWNLSPGGNTSLHHSLPQHQSWLSCTSRPHKPKSRLHSLTTPECVELGIPQAEAETGQRMLLHAGHVHPPTRQTADSRT